MAGLEPARTFYGPTDFNPPIYALESPALPFCCHFWLVFGSSSARDADAKDRLLMRCLRVVISRCRRGPLQAHSA